ncbi:MAG: hypothetical protein HC860_00285 [Alkalinema sp. RU_4_3]|nr:hypothetical protein [Alkalinema sp. RU_4_3]
MQMLSWYQSVIYASAISCCFLFDTVPVGAVPSIEATATNIATSLPIAGTSATTEIRQVANLQISTEAVGGLKLVISQNSLTKSDSTPIPVQFLAIADGSAAPDSASFTTAANTNYEYLTSAAGTTKLNLYVKYTTGQSQDPGNYTTTLDLLVEDNP